MSCRACGMSHPSHIRCEIWARQSASNKEGASNNASNRLGENSRSAQAVGADGGGQKAVDIGAGQVGDDGVERCRGETKQRWSREAYNAYQREYMKKRRARSLP